jgi:hypothetical protein
VFCFLFCCEGDVEGEVGGEEEVRKLVKASRAPGREEAVVGRIVGGGSGAVYGIRMSWPATMIVYCSTT